MKFLAKPTDPIKIETDMLVVFAYQGQKEGAVEYTPEAKSVDDVLGGMLEKTVTEEVFEAELGSTTSLHTHGKIGSSRVLLVGLGKIKELTIYKLETIAATIAREAKNVSVKRVGIAVPSIVFDQFAVSKVAQTLVEGMVLGSYVFNRHKSQKTQDKEKRIDECIVLVGANKLDAITDGVKRGEVVADAVCFARDLVNEPSSVTTPTYLAGVAKSLAKQNSSIRSEVFDKEAIGKLGMGAFLGIAKGSEEEPKFISLSYNGGGKKTVTLVGKGITFDSGGLSLKPSASMETMKMDMAGAAAILGIFHVIAQLKPSVNVVGLIAATENMPSGHAVKPGDVVRAMNGKTIEILNTDAEGRVILADALSYAVATFKSDAIIDLATLTGACMVALGEDIAGLFANNETLASQLKQSALLTGERVWELPLVPEYKKLLKSSVADIKNISGSKYGGAINGAMFLAEFVPDAQAWAHIDIAGPAFAEKDAPLTPVGGTGFGVRMILEYLL
jgi:leucyl aminopeptidase